MKLSYFQSSICPVQPEENEKPTSEHIQQVLRQTISLDVIKKSEATKLVELVVSIFTGIYPYIRVYRLS